MSERKRLLKLASRIPPERIAGVLEVADDIPSGYFLIGDDPDHYLVCCWHVANGLMSMIIEDDALAVACKRYLLANGAPVFRSTEEAEAHAAAQGWPGRRANA
ncbi:hypothetical protein OJF2_34420 [Aquisphaera giovannonii]|uniref:Uncharacterized protein n=1 Tax=Aquisphaera giovannonii TaxID=406548 RepID=A0A5B9W3S6_9BACT|nr:hypothetical protein [Aquisphaera giovannonii]QEH34897.1 hypothetical protein OJF2_34420 [Aquisphaera giovannonii]